MTELTPVKYQTKRRYEDAVMITGRGGYATFACGRYRP